MKTKFKIGDLVMISAKTHIRSIKAIGIIEFFIENTHIWPITVKFIQIIENKNWPLAGEAGDRFAEQELSYFLSPLEILEQIL